MSMKKPAVLLAFVGACALVFTGPASVASPLRAGPVPAEDTPASSLPVGDLDTALTSKDGQAPEVAEVVDRDLARLVGVIVQLEEGIDRSAALASMNEAVAASFPGVQVRVEREYANVLDGFALSAPAGSLEEIRGVAGVKAAFLEREGHVSDAAAVDAEGGTRASQIEGQDPANLSAQLMMRTDQVTQKGEGKVVAIIDTGVDMTHQAFTPALTATPALSEDRVDELKAQLGEGKTGVYVNEKFPFAYDYADGDNDASPREGGSGFHGTHVAGIAAGNADKIVGTAPDAQIIVGKVTRTEDDALLDSALLAALDDMLVLHPDVINLSLGWTAGMDNEADTVYATVYKKLQEAGITVNAAAGNAFSTGYGNMSGKGLPYASDPDSSVIDEPATYPSVVAVASVENALIRNAFTAAGKDIGYQRSRGMNGEKVAYFSDLPAGTYEYVDAGFASEEDVAALTEKYPDGLAGKIALVSRGNMTYQKKVENLYDLHPAGILVYNNVSVGSLIIMNLTTQDVPAAFISQADGQAMLGAADHHLTMAEGQVLPQSSVYEASEFSSGGVSPDLRLKPEIAAPGGNVFSAIPNGAYEQTSGTSMATPQMAGISAIVLQRVQSDPLFASMSAREKVDVVQNLIMGTARPLTDAAQDSGVLYSPRKQGSGLVDALAATTSSVYPTVEGAPEVSRPKADLGDGTTGWHFDVVLHNLSDTEATYELGSQALSEIVDGGFFTEHSLDWRGRGVAVSYSGAVSGAGEGATVTVPAKGEATVGVDIVPGFEFAQYVADNASSGTFLDGFVRFTSRTESQPSLSVPYLGFYGDWGKPAIFDALASEGYGHTHASQIVNGATGNQLGYNPLIKVGAREGRPNADRYVISRSGAPGAPTILEPRTGTLRSVHTLTSTYTNEAGEKVASVTNHRNWKSVYLTSTEENTWVEAYHEPTALDSRSDAYKDLPDGEYTLTIEASNDGPSSAEQSISYKFHLDATAPVISNLTLGAITDFRLGAGGVGRAVDGRVHGRGRGRLNVHEACALLTRGVIGTGAGVRIGDGDSGAHDEVLDDVGLLARAHRGEERVVLNALKHDGADAGDLRGRHGRAGHVLVAATGDGGVDIATGGGHLRLEAHVRRYAPRAEVRHLVGTATVPRVFDGGHRHDGREGGGFAQGRGVRVGGVGQVLARLVAVSSRVFVAGGHVDDSAVVLQLLVHAREQGVGRTVHAGCAAEGQVHDVRLNDRHVVQGGEQRGVGDAAAAARDLADDDLSIGGNTRDLTTVGCGDASNVRAVRTSR